MSDICIKVQQLSDKVDNGEIDLEELGKEMQKKTHILYEASEDYTEDEIVYKKGSYDWYLTVRQLDTQNKINQLATKYMNLFFYVLHTDYGFGAERLKRVRLKTKELLDIYQYHKEVFASWREELRDYAGMDIEDPVDPLTKKRGSYLTQGGIF